MLGDTSVTTGEGRGRIRVVVVDDHAMILESLRRILDTCDDIHVVDVAATAAAALAAVAKLRPDVVLMDYVLPDEDGITAAKRMKTTNPETRVVIVTGSGDDERIALRAIEAGCSGFIGKSRPVDELVAAVRAAHAGEAVISPSMLVRLLPRLERNYAGAAGDLTPRQLEVLRVMAEGGSDKDIATRLTISVNTARKHVQNVIRKLGVHSKLEAVVVAVREGLIEAL